MKPNVKITHGKFESGRTGIRFSHNINVGDTVRLPGGFTGKVISEGLAGMPEVEHPDGSSELYSPSELMLIYPCRECGTMGLEIAGTICPICGGE